MALTRIRSAAGIGLLVTAAVFLTACNPESSDGAASSTSPSAAPAAHDDKPTASPSQDTGAGTADSGGKDTAGAPGDGSGDTGAHTDSCTTKDLEFSTSKQSRPINHIMLQAVNRSDSACLLVGYPLLKFSDDQQAVTRALEDSKPQSVVVLKPGAKAYASTNIFDASGESEGPVEELTSFQVSLQGSEGGEPSAQATVPTPGGDPLSVDIGAAFVTYWHSNAADAANNS